MTVEVIKWAIVAKSEATKIHLPFWNSKTSLQRGIWKYWEKVYCTYYKTWTNSVLYKILLSASEQLFILLMRERLLDVAIIAPIRARCASSHLKESNLAEALQPKSTWNGTGFSKPLIIVISNLQLKSICLLCSGWTKLQFYIGSDSPSPRTQNTQCKIWS